MSMVNKKLTLRNTLSGLAVLVFSPILLTVTFLLYALINLFYDHIIPGKPNEGLIPYFFLRPITLFAALAILSWFVFRSRLATLYKAIYTAVPVATVLVFIGIAFESQSGLVYSFGALFSLGVLTYLLLTKKPWLYFFSVVVVTIALFMMTLLGMEI